MRRIQTVIFLSIFLIAACKDKKMDTEDNPSNTVGKTTMNQPTVSFTFDDGNTSDLAGFPFEEWNSMILSHLEKEHLTAIFFVTGKNKMDEKGQFLLKSWNDKGHKIGNHSFSHPNFNSEKNTSSLFESELGKTDSIISKFTNSIKLFRFPYLKEGQNQAKVDSIRNILQKLGYSNGYVTIDASDWFIDQRMRNRIKEVGLENTEIGKYRDFYLEHIMERANYYESLSYEMNQRHIPHTLLLHHNLTSALFLGDLIKNFKEKGWKVTHADKAYQDTIFEQIPNAAYAGESLIYSMAKQSGKYKQSLRYPAEDSRYEKGKMEKLGL